MPFLARLASAAARALGFVARSGISVAPTLNSLNGIAQSTINISWTNTSSLYSINIYRDNSLITTAGANTTSASISGSCNTTHQIKLAYAGLGGLIGPFSNTLSVYVPPLSNGTYLTQYCSGCVLYYRFWDGACGVYDVIQSYNSPTCCAPALSGRGTAIGYDYYGGCCCSVLVYTDTPCGGYYGSSTMCATGVATAGGCSSAGTYTVYGGTCTYAELVLYLGRSASQAYDYGWYVGVVNSCGHFSYGGYAAYLS